MGEIHARICGIGTDGNAAVLKRCLFSRLFIWQFDGQCSTVGFPRGTEGSGVQTSVQRWSTNAQALRCPQVGSRTRRGSPPQVPYSKVYAPRLPVEWALCTSGIWVVTPGISGNASAASNPTSVPLRNGSTLISWIFLNPEVIPDSELRSREPRNSAICARRSSTHFLKNSRE